MTRSLTGTLNKANNRLLRPLMRRSVDQFFVVHRTRLTNIYHCCQQRTASRWMLGILNDFAVFRHCGLRVFDPRTNFVTQENRGQLLRGLPSNRIISPVYARYTEFRDMPKSGDYRAIFVGRDPRDLVVSKYFSQKHSHPLISDWMAERREILSGLNDEDGLQFVIDDSGNAVVDAMSTWLQAADDPNVLLLRFEDLTGERQVATFRKVFDHLQVPIADDELTELLARHSFAKKSGGRQRGSEDRHSHYRNGKQGDWRRYLSDRHVDRIKQIMSPVILGFGYEETSDW